MFIAMNRFKIALGKESDFVEMWQKRESHLDTVPGFQAFHLLRGPYYEEYTLFASHSIWDSREAFENWTRSEAFRMAHAHAGGAKGMYLGPPQLETFDVVIENVTHQHDNSSTTG